MPTAQHLAARGFAFALSLLLCCYPVMGQQGGGGLRGRVRDQLGAALPGAAVTVVDAEGKERRVSTNGDGLYVINGLRPGKYGVRVLAEGFSEFDGEVTVGAGDPTTLDAELKIEINEEVTVDPERDRVGLDPEDNKSGLILRGSDLDALSDDPDQLAADLQAMSGTFGGGGGAQFIVDGFSGGRLPPKSSIREVRLNVNPFAAEFDAFGLGRIEVFTRPGSAQFNGQVFMLFGDESLNARNPLAAARADFQVRQFGGNLTGPLSRASSFFVDVEQRDIDENAVISATLLDAALNPTALGLAVVTPQRRTNLSARLDHQLHPNHTLVARYGLLHQRFDNENVGGFSLLSQAIDARRTEHTIQLTETAVLSQRVLNETRFQFVRSSFDQTPGDTTPTILVQGAFIGGGARSGLSLNETNRFELQNHTTWARGPHTVKFGGRLRFSDITDVSRPNFNGVFVFSSLAQYQQVLAGVPGARPTQFLTGEGEESSDVSRTDFGAYVQGDWRVKPNFTFSYGLRVETQNNIHGRVDFAPRLGFAWAPGASADTRRPVTVVRGGAGLFYNRFDEDLTLQSLRFDGTTQNQVIVNSPDFFPSTPPAKSQGGVTPLTLIPLADDLNAPRGMYGALSVERQLPLRTTLGVTYVVEVDRRLLRSRNINAPLPGTFTPGVPGSGVRPQGGAGNIFLYESSGKATGHMVLINLRSQLHSRLNVFGVVRFVREKSDTEGPNFFPANSYDLSGEYGLASGSVGPSTFIGASVNLPWGLSLSPLVRASSGRRFNIITGRDTNGDTVFTERPALANNPGDPGVVVTEFGAFNPNPGPGDVIIPRNFGKGPSTFFVNLRLSKVFSFGTNRRAAAQQPQGQPGQQGARPPAGVTVPPGGSVTQVPGGIRISRGSGGSVSTAPGSGTDRPYSLTFSIQAQNLFNQTNLAPYIGNLSSPNFGQANALAGSPRRIDLQVRFGF